MCYFITFTCYGTRLHGDESGSVDRHNSLVGSRRLEPDTFRVLAESREMLQDPYVLDEAARQSVLAAIRKHCAHRGWNLQVAHLRSNHVHVIVEAGIRPERIMNEFKAYASRALNQLTSEGPYRKRWSRHGSTRWLWKEEDVSHALRYVVEEQGKPMALFVSDKL